MMMLKAICRISPIGLFSKAGFVAVAAALLAVGCGQLDDDPLGDDELAEQHEQLFVEFQREYAPPEGDYFPESGVTTVHPERDQRAPMIIDEDVLKFSRYARSKMRVHDDYLEVPLEGFEALLQLNPGDIVISELRRAEFWREVVEVQRLGDSIRIHTAEAAFDQVVLSGDFYFRIEGDGVPPENFDLMDPYLDHAGVTQLRHGLEEEVSEADIEQIEEDLRSTDDQCIQDAFAEEWGEEVSYASVEFWLMEERPRDETEDSEWFQEAAQEWENSIRDPFNSWIQSLRSDAYEDATNTDWGDPDDDGGWFSSPDSIYEIQDDYVIESGCNGEHGWTHDEAVAEIQSFMSTYEGSTGWQNYVDQVDEYESYESDRENCLDIDDPEARATCFENLANSYDPYPPPHPDPPPTLDTTDALQCTQAYFYDRFVEDMAEDLAYMLKAQESTDEDLDDMHDPSAEEKMDTLCDHLEGKEEEASFGDRIKELIEDAVLQTLFPYHEFSDFAGGVDGVLDPMCEAMCEENAPAGQDYDECIDRCWEFTPCISPGLSWDDENGFDFMVDRNTGTPLDMMGDFINNPCSDRTTCYDGEVASAPEDTADEYCQEHHDDDSVCTSRNLCMECEPDAGDCGPGEECDPIEGECVEEDEDLVDTSMSASLETDVCFQFNHIDADVDPVFEYDLSLSIRSGPSLDITMGADITMEFGVDIIIAAELNWNYSKGIDVPTPISISIGPIGIGIFAYVQLDIGFSVYGETAFEINKQMEYFAGLELSLPGEGKDSDEDNEEDPDDDAYEEDSVRLAGAKIGAEANVAISAGFKLVAPSGDALSALEDVGRDAVCPGELASAGDYLDDAIDSLTSPVVTLELLQILASAGIHIEPPDCTYDVGLWVAALILEYDIGIDFRVGSISRSGSFDILDEVFGIETPWEVFRWQGQIFEEDDFIANALSGALSFLDAYCVGGDESVPPPDPFEGDLRSCSDDSDCEDFEQQADAELVCAPNELCVENEGLRATLDWDAPVDLNLVAQVVNSDSPQHSDGTLYQSPGPLNDVFTFWQCGETCDDDVLTDGNYVENINFEDARPGDVFRFYVRENPSAPPSPHLDDDTELVNYNIEFEYDDQLHTVGGTLDLMENPGSDEAPRTVEYQYCVPPYDNQECAGIEIN